MNTWFKPNLAHFKSTDIIFITKLLENIQKMKPLVSYSRILTWFCVYPEDKNIKKLENAFHVIFCVCIFSGNVIGLITSFAFFLKFLSIDLGSSLYAMFQIICCVGTIYGIILILIIRKSITNTFKNLSKIYEKCNLICFL